ncbi:MAG: sigma-70 family RNA polymerase sigma factor [Cyanobacteria bacterium]|nr:sigma-70 family RNA polymerase sigma factor [Cyanobacteriota bacterium]MDA0867721.1 sigma-70 family RNA polymerase sigma factor [Cyanobacteriota bacterium]
MSVQIPLFPEASHEIVQQLAPLSDRDLLNRFKADPTAGRYFTTIFCRYSPIVYSLIRHSARSPVQADYLFALTWRHILNELGGLVLPPEEQAHRTNGDQNQSTTSLQSWLINITAVCINQAILPEVEDIHYVLAEASPPLWCYTERALNQLDPIERLIIIMAQTFRWSDTRIAAYLQAEGEQITPVAVANRLRVACRHLAEALPEDIRQIYLPTQPAPAAGIASQVPELVAASPD